MHCKWTVKWKKWVQSHALLSIILAVQILFLLFLVAGLFRPAYSVRITANNFENSLASAAVNEYQISFDGDSICFLLDNTAQQLAVEDDTETTDLTSLITSAFSLRSGAYKVVVQYQTDSTSSGTEVAEIAFSEPRFSDLVYSETITLYGAENTVNGRIWVPMGAHAESVQAELTPLGTCNFQIDEILLQEQVVYRWVRLLGFLLLFVVADFIGTWLFGQCAGKPSEVLRRHGVVVALGLICILACLPFFCDGILWGDDISFHLTRIAQLATSLQERQFPARIYTDMLNGYGYATPLYYCDIFLYIPAILFNCMLPLQTCYKIYGVLVTAATAGIGYISLHHIFKQKEIAVVGTAIYLLAGYRLCNVHMRAAVGEYTAMVWLPLVVWGIYEIYTKERPAWQQWMPLAVGMAGLVLCHIITFEITCGFLALFCLLRMRTTFQPFRIAALGKAAGVCIALCAWFVVPMLYSVVTQQIRGTQVVRTNFQSNGVSLYELLAYFPTQNKGTSLGAIGATLTMGALLAAFVAANRDRWEKMTKTIQTLLQWSLLLGVTATVFACDKFPWNSLLSHVDGTIIHKLIALPQFPWRYLTIGTILLVVAITAALYLLRQNKPDWYTTARNLLLGTAVLYTALFSYNLLLTRTEVVKYDPIGNGQNTIGNGEYQLDGDVDLNYPRPLTDNASLLIKWYSKTGGVAYITLENSSEEEAAVVLPIYNYGNYHAVDEDGNEWPLAMSQNALLQLTVPGGYSGTISVAYREPLLWRVCELISLATGVVIVLVWLRERKRRKI